jgi:hypothetical protein
MSRVVSRIRALLRSSRSITCGRTDEELRQENEAVIRWTAVIDELRS